MFPIIMVKMVDQNSTFKYSVCLSNQFTRYFVAKVNRQMGALFFRAHAHLHSSLISG